MIPVEHRVTVLIAGRCGPVNCCRSFSRIYDPKISDKEMLHILQVQAAAGVEIKVIGSVAGHGQLDEQKLSGTRLHTRVIISDRRHAFVGSQSLRAAELDSRRELGLIVHDAAVVKTLVETFESDWAASKAKKRLARWKRPDASDEDVTRAIQVFTKELDPLTASVKRAVRQAVAKAGEDVLNDRDVNETMKKVVKRAVKEAVKKAVEDAEDVQDVERARKRKRGPADSRSRAARISQPIVKGGARRSTFHRAAPRRLIGTIRASLHSRTCQ